MKIVYCLLETYTPGGIARVASLKANYLANLGWEVFIVTTDQGARKPYYKIGERVKQIDLNINLLSNTKDNPILWCVRKRKLTILHKKRLKELLMDLKADYTVSTFSNDADFLYEIQDGSKKILECHFNHDFYEITSKVYKYSFWKKCYAHYKTWKNERLVIKYDAFIPLTQEDYVLWGGNKNMHVIPNILSFHNKTRKFNRLKRVMAVGHFNEQKSFDKLIRIWETVHKDCPDWSLHIYGDGPDKDKYTNLICELNLSDCCEIHPSTQNIEMEYNQSSILCMTSTYEGLPMVLLEAMACGLPIIAYTCKCGPKDVIKDGVTGYCVEENEGSTFGNKLLRLIKDDELRLKMMNNSYDESLKYSDKIIMEKWLKLFNKI